MGRSPSRLWRLLHQPDPHQQELFELLEEELGQPPSRLLHEEDLVDLVLLHGEDLVDLVLHGEDLVDLVLHEEDLVDLLQQYVGD